MVHWTLKFWILWNYRVHLKLCGCEVPERTKHVVVSFRFLSLKLWHPGGCHNVAGSKIKASRPAKSSLWCWDALKQEPCFILACTFMVTALSNSATLGSSLRGNAATLLSGIESNYLQYCAQSGIIINLLARRCLSLDHPKQQYCTCTNIIFKATFVNCGHLKNFFTAPWLKNLEYSYLLPKYSVKISREKKWAFSFYFTFCKRGILHVSLWRVAFFHEICTVWRVNAVVHSVKFQIREQSSFLNVLYHSA